MIVAFSEVLSWIWHFCLIIIFGRLVIGQMMADRSNIFIPVTCWMFSRRFMYLYAVFLEILRQNCLTGS